MHLLFFVNFGTDSKLYLNDGTNITSYNTMLEDNLTLPIEDITEVLPFGKVMVDCP